MPPRRPYEPAMMQPSPDRLSGPPAAIEVRVERTGPGQRRWRWALWRDDTVIVQSPAGFAGAEEAYEAGRTVLLRPRPAAEHRE